MKTNVRDTSLAAYDHLRDTGKVGKQAQTILDSFRFGWDYSLREIAQNTDLEINAVSGRVNDLKKLGLLVEAEKRACLITGRTITPVMLPPAQKELFS